MLLLSLQFVKSTSACCCGRVHLGLFGLHLCHGFEFCLAVAATDATRACYVALLLQPRPPLMFALLAVRMRGAMLGMSC
jgi:hypothetical protein